MSNKPNLKNLKSQYELDLKAERTLLSVTDGMSGKDLSEFLESFGIPREEYDYICHKHRHALHLLKESKKGESHV